MVSPIRDMNLENEPPSIKGSNILSGITKWGAFLYNTALSCPTSLTNARSSCFKYRSPPCISLVDLLLVPEAKSFFSMSSAFKPLVVASRRIPAPVMPPPIMIKSYSCDPSEERTLSRSCEDKQFIGLRGLSHQAFDLLKHPFQLILSKLAVCSWQ